MMVCDQNGVCDYDGVIMMVGDYDGVCDYDGV